MDESTSRFGSCARMIAAEDAFSRLPRGKRLVFRIMRQPSLDPGKTEELTVKRRRRFNQTTTLAQRLTREAARLRERARKLPPGAEQALMWRKIRQTETALRIDAWLASKESSPPDNVPGSLGGHRKRQPAAKPTQEPA
jgi:hypothetical protein